MPYGRGGAGNIYAAEQAKARITADLEANHAATDSYKEPLPADYLRHEQQQYAHTGRGGSGNYYSPKELTRTGQFSDTHKSQSNESSRIGRGGAGNYTFAVSDSEEQARRRMEEEGKCQKLQRDVEKGVNQSLTMPPKAKLASS